MIVRIAAIAVALAMPGASALANSHEAAAPQRGVDGTNVTRVFHTGGGSFEHLENGRWVEFGDEGTLIHEFNEQRRDASGVWLIDPSRGVRVVIDLRRREISGTPTFGPPRLLYQITDVDSDRRGRGWRGRRGGNGGYGGNGGGWDRGGARDVEVGPIWSQRDAETKCANKARELRGTWNGQWRTTVQGRMSVCEIETDRRGGGGGGWGGRNDGVSRNIEVGPIWNQADAETKCRNKAREMRGDWTGQWSTTIQGRMSVCEIRFR